MSNPKPKPYTVLTVVASQSGSWSYEIRTSHRDGVTYCTCRSWIFRKTCKHMDAWLANPTVVAIAPKVNTLPPMPPTPIVDTMPDVSAVQSRAELINRIAAIVRDESDVTSLLGARRIARRIVRELDLSPLPTAAPTAPVVAESTIVATTVRTIYLPD